MPEGNDAFQAGKGSESDSRHGNERLTTRRGCIKAAGAVLGSTPFVGAAAATLSSDLPNLLTVASDVGKSTYRFTVSGDLQKSTEGGATVDDQDAIDGATASGHVWGGRDSYRFSGEVTDFSMTGRASVFLNGLEVDPEQLDGGLPTLLTIAGDQGKANYEFTVSGDLQKSTEGGATVDDQDAVDGATASGHVWGGRDSYRFSGEVTDFALDAPATVYLDGKAVDPDRLGAGDSSGGDDSASDGDDSSSQVEFSIASLTDTYTYYTVEVTATSAPAPVTSDADLEGRLVAEADDAVTEIEAGRYLIEGRTGTASGSPPAYGDTFRWDTTDDTWGIRGFSYRGGAESDLTITIDGQDVSPSDLPRRETDDDGGGEPGGDSSTEVGGGDGYENTVSQSEASVVVNTESELLNALWSASSGEVVYVPGGTTISTNRKLTVPAGVTLASDRGIDGSPGGEIRTETALWPFVTAGNGARITGVQVGGPHLQHRAYDSSITISIGIEARGASNVEVDNCEVSGFRHAGVRTGGDTHVHHNHIHHCAFGGFGYGVATSGGHPVIEYNHVNYTRHGVSNESGSGGYTCRYNLFGPDTFGQVIDVHEPGGTTTEIYSNTVEAATYHPDATASWYPGGEPAIQVAIRGVPSDVADIHHNWFHNPNDPASGGNAVVQVGTDGWNSVRVSNNHYGSSDPGSSIGHPR